MKIPMKLWPGYGALTRDQFYRAVIAIRILTGRDFRVPELGRAARNYMLRRLL